MNIELIKMLLSIAISTSIVTTSFIQKIKYASFIKNSDYLVYISFVFSMIIGVLFTMTFTNYNFLDSLWVGFFSFIGADTLYKAFEDKVFKSFSDINKVIDIERTDL